MLFRHYALMHEIIFTVFTRLIAVWIITLSNTYTLSRTPLDEGSARRRGLYLHNTQHSQETDIHALCGIRTRSPNKRAAVDLRLRPHGHRDRPFGYVGMYRARGQ
jgi:hypothetical protein